MKLRIPARPQRRKSHAKTRAAEMYDVATVRARDPTHDREPQAAASRARSLGEALEEPRFELRFDTRPVVVDFHDRGVGSQRDAYRDARPRVRACVRQEVSDELRQTTLVATYEHAFDARIDCDIARADFGFDVAKRVSNDDREIDGLAIETARIRATGEREEVADEGSAIDRASCDRRERGGIVALGTIASDLSDARDRGERSPQFVRGIGGEALLALARAEKRAQRRTREHVRGDADDEQQGDVGKKDRIRSRPHGGRKPRATFNRVQCGRDDRPIIRFDQDVGRDRKRDDDRGEDR
ncbi:MAG: hypothetical protein NVS3B16_26560 [Vulcanimicrobiaceae bacterium]